MSPARRESCAWCGAPFDSGAERTGGRTFCARCGVGTADPWPSPEELAEAYGGWYRPVGGRFGFGDRVLGLTRGALARRLDRLAPPGPILDVGAGEGHLVDALRKRGRDAEGLDPYSDRGDFLTGDVGDVSGSWAGVVFWHSLEHLPQPIAALRAAADLLVPEGIVAIALPNTSSLQARFFGDRWLAVDLPRHLVHVPSRALLSQLENERLSIERISYLRGGQVLFGWLHGLVLSLVGLDLYDSIRTPAARSRPLRPWQRALALIAATLLLPLGLLAVAVETILRRGGTLYVEARAARSLVSR